MRKLLTIILSATALTTAVNANAERAHCDATYQGKPFVQATIWSGPDGFGPVECDYKTKEDTVLTVYSFPKEDQYYRVSGIWRSTMPGFQWCSVDDGNTAETCVFAKRER